ncbi:DUF5988 family protein [Amycolatopsis silviterrae]|uniref:DUF5988 family protein n=1 Tax=Amycolatopsis silviterrae TaxID=1656914 RepID=A0ABW5H3X1_9PSEU
MSGAARCTLVFRGVVDAEETPGSAKGMIEMEKVRIVLAGGPAELRESAVTEVDSLHEKVKIAFASGYEHFSHSGEVAEVDGAVLPVFRWCARTRIAE